MEKQQPTTNSQLPILYLALSEIALFKFSGVLRRL